MNCRAFLVSSAATALGAWPGSSWALAPPAKPKARVIVIGGGMGGATLAKYMRLWGDAVAVTLVERRPKYVSSIMSNLVLTGQRTIPSLTFAYDDLKNRYGVEVKSDDAVAIDAARPSVRLASGTVLDAERIVMAPGIDFDAVPGLDDGNRMPHAWQAGPQTTLLAKQLAEMAPTPRSSSIVAAWKSFLLIQRA